MTSSGNARADGVGILVVMSAWAWQYGQDDREQGGANDGEERMCAQGTNLVWVIVNYRSDSVSSESQVGLDTDGRHGVSEWGVVNFERREGTCVDALVATHEGGCTGTDTGTSMDHCKGLRMVHTHLEGNQAQSRGGSNDGGGAEPVTDNWHVDLQPDNIPMQLTHTVNASKQLQNLLIEDIQPDLFGGNC
ncbi:hypothetical protein BDV93DRAFT_516115 [Ceratobasidium sp. AG-I]|nr:hypothetical protein BDV93DRAFT_516115 [Ceratobasidium sp. AG-I]